MNTTIGETELKDYERFRVRAYIEGPTFGDTALVRKDELADSKDQSRVPPIAYLELGEGPRGEVHVAPITDEKVLRGIATAQRLILTLDEISLTNN